MKISPSLSLKHLALNHLTLKHFLLTLLFITTACAPITPTPRALTFQSLTVTPPTGRGDFMVSVSYTPGAQDDHIVCHFTVKDDELGRGNVIGQITVRGQAEPSSQSTDLEFSLSSPGTYVVDCSAISNGNQVTTDITVTP
jgi:hypothetical protein